MGAKRQREAARDGHRSWTPVDPVKAISFTLALYKRWLADIERAHRGGKGPDKVLWYREVLAIADAHPGEPFEKVWALLRAHAKDDDGVLRPVRDEHGNLQCEHVVGRQCIDKSAAHLHWQAPRSPLRTVTKATIQKFISTASPRRKKPTRSR